MPRPGLPVMIVKTTGHDPRNAPINVLACQSTRSMTGCEEHKTPPTRPRLVAQQAVATTTVMQTSCSAL
eukprot:14805087-Alexandrium_andersonii.AAC.1